MHHDGDILSCCRIEEWCELHINNHYTDSKGARRSDHTSVCRTTRLYRQEISRKEELENSTVVAHDISINREEELE